MRRSFVARLLVVLLLPGLGAVAGSLPAAGSAGVPSQPRGSGPVWAPALGQVGSPALSAGASSAQGAEAAPAQNRDYVSDQVIVVFKHGATRAERALVRGALGAAEVLQAHHVPHLFPTPTSGRCRAAWACAQPPSRSAPTATSSGLSPNYLYHLAFTPNDTWLPEQWGLDNTGQTMGGVVGVPGADIGAFEAWDVERGTSSPVTVAVLDTGTDITHPDLAPRLWTNADEVAANGVDDDGNGYVDDVNGYNWAGASSAAGPTS